MKLLLRLIGTAALLIATMQTLRIGYSDYLFRKDTQASVERAVRIWPRDGNYHARLADFDSTNAILHLRRAVALNPGLSRSWIQLGLLVELLGGVEEAERCYLEAARRDHQFLPAWTLANFYARRNDAERFWPWARRAAGMSYSDLRPLFRLAFEFTTSPEKVRERMLPPLRPVEHEFLRYLLSERLDGATMGARLLGKASREDVPVLFEWMDRLLEGRRVSEARKIWDALSDKRLIPYAHAGLLTNADFSHEPLGAGFDWRISAPPGVNCTRVAGGGLQVQFSGRQPETFELASQQLDLAPQSSYVLSLEYRTVDLGGSTNLRWRLGDTVSSPLGPAEKWTRWTWTFRPGTINRLTLMDRRDPGTIRPEGVVYMRGLALTQLMAKQYSKPAPPVLIKLSWLQPRLGWVEFHDVFPPPVRSKWPSWAVPAPSLLQLLQVWSAPSV